MSAESTNVIPLFGYLQEKRFKKALEHLCLAYEAHLTAEQEVLKALVQIGRDGDNMTLEEKSYVFILTKRAWFLRRSGKHIRKIMRDISGGEAVYGEEESSED